MTMDSWSTLTFYNDDNNSYTTVNLDEGGITLITILKSIVAGLVVYQGYHGIKTFKPIVKEHSHPHL